MGAPPLAAPIEVVVNEVIFVVEVFVVFGESRRLGVIILIGRNLCACQKRSMIAVARRLRKRSSVSVGSASRAANHHSRSHHRIALFGREGIDLTDKLPKSWAGSFEIRVDNRALMPPPGSRTPLRCCREIRRTRTVTIDIVITSHGDEGVVRGDARNHKPVVRSATSLASNIAPCREGRRRASTFFARSELRGRFQ